MTRKGVILTEKTTNTIIKRSVLLAGHRTSVTLEGAFWDELSLIAKRRDVSLNRLITQIDASRTGNLASALRLFVLEEVKKATPS
ncbi:MAG TPA: aryl-sulfate sulfotransferase [Rhodospirillaceae bacterium]|nr:aryl-sulfate sulfotransferase [Rhodospirillaceae bacterium]